jgi:hypothetical protein
LFAEVPGSYIVSQAISTISFITTVGEYKEGNMDPIDFGRTFILYVTGWIPGAGVIPEALQVYYDLR